MLVNINKLKPYRFIEDITLQPILVKYSDLAIDEHVQTREPKPLLVEPKDRQPIQFEPINNCLTPNNIKRIDVHVHYYHDVFV